MRAAWRRLSPIGGSKYANSNDKLKGPERLAARRRRHKRGRHLEPKGARFAQMGKDELW